MVHSILFLLLSLEYKAVTLSQNFPPESYSHIPKNQIQHGLSNMKLYAICTVIYFM